MTTEVKKTAGKIRGAAALGAGPGRPKGVPNKTTTTLKEAILLAAKNIGKDGKGQNGLTGYLENLAMTEPTSFATLLGKVLPLQVTGEGGGPIQLSTELARLNGIK